MKKRAFFLFLVALLFLSGCVSEAVYDSKVRETQSLTAENEALQAKVNDMSAELSTLRKEREMTQMERDALKNNVDELTQKAGKAERLEKATATYEQLQKKLENEIREGQVQLSEMKNRLTVTMVNRILFPPGGVEISPEGKRVLDKVVDILSDVKDKRIQVEGHTDNVPIRVLKKRYPTNWELSTARATEVVRYLQESGHIDPRLLSATGFSEYQPVAANDSDAGRSKNRRIEIVLLPLLK